MRNTLVRSQEYCGLASPLLELGVGMENMSQYYYNKIYKYSRLTDLGPEQRRGGTVYVWAYFKVFFCFAAYWAVAVPITQNKRSCYGWVTINEVIVNRVMMYANPLLIVQVMNYTETYCIFVYYKEILAKPIAYHYL